ncbi:MAG: histidine--tRNA ligase [Candidatus Nanohaloarchaea archaeon]
MEIKGLKGFYDRYPEEQASWRKLVDTVEETAREFGFREIDTPNVERTELYRVKSGDELLDQTYSFKDKGGRDVTLIPEQTPTRARLVQQRKDLKTPIKWFDTSKRWRYEDVQRGRDREFLQGDFDIFGIESVEADAEVIAAAATIYQKLDLDSRVKFLVNDRQLLESILESQGIENREEVLSTVDDKEKMSREEFLEELEDAGLDREQAEDVDSITSISGPIAETVEEVREEAPKEAMETVERLESLASALEAYGVEGMCRLDLSIYRGLAYYTGLVFEAFDAEGELRALFGGGRYDDLVGLFGSREVPAVGFAFGYSPTVELLKKEDRWPIAETKTDVYVLSVSGSVRDRAMEYASKLRGKGLVVETDLSGRSFGKQLSYADSINSKRVLIVGERDLENGEVTMKHMDTGKEETIPEDGVLEHLGSEGFF